MNLARLTAPDGYTLGPCVGGLAGRTLVFSAVDSLGHPCALKTIDPDATGVPLVEIRFAAECNWHAAANGCANVLPLRENRDTRWLITAWAHGGSIADLINNQDFTIEAVHALSVVVALLNACRDLHARGIVHRDIKPSNVLRDGSRIWLADFGLAAGRDEFGNWRALPEPWIETDIGSPEWAAPELRNNPPLSSPANDVYGVAKVWGAMSARTHDESIEHRAIRQRMLHLNPQERPTIDEVLALLS